MVEVPIDAVVEIIKALLIALPTTLAVIFAARKASNDAVKAADKLQEVHILVNSHMEQALKDIRELKEELLVSKDKEEK